MVGKQRITINGVELPEEFFGGSIINNVAISPDGKRYAAVTKAGGIVTGKIPSDGRIEIDGTVIDYRGGSGPGIRISGSRIYSGGSVLISGGGHQVSIVGGNLEHEIDKGYSGVNKLTLRERANDVDLGFSDDGLVYVKGHTNAQPKNQSGELFVDGLEGKLTVPKSNPELELDIHTSAGDVDGDVAHRGRIRTSAGNITLDLYGPVTLETRTSAGTVRVRGMISDGRGAYTPPNANPLGTLVLETSAGNIKVNYRPG